MIDTNISEPQSCLCGCGQATSRDFLPGHDQKAIHAIIREHYGTVTDFVAAHAPKAENTDADPAS